MIKTSKYSYNMLELGDIWYPGYDRENMETVENQINALISFVGPGVIDGWDVTKISIPSGDDTIDADYRAEQLALIQAYDADPYSRLGRQFSLLGLVSPIDSCQTASVSNLTLSGLQKIDGIDIVAGNRILVKNQTTQTENGIYIAASGAWTRATDFDNNSELSANMIIRVLSGSDNANTLWALSPPITASVSPYTYVIGTNKLFFHNAWEQVIRVTPGHGFVGKWAARTDVIAYFRFTVSNIYYAWVEASNCLVTEGLAAIVVPIDPDIDFALTHTAAFLSEIWVSQKNNANSDGDYRIYIDRIVYSDQRQVLKDLASALDKALKKAFYRHVHLGGNDHPSKINLSTKLVLDAVGPEGSTIFLIQDSKGKTFTWKSSDYGLPVVKLNDVELPITSYVINSNQGKLYLQNSISSGSTLKVILPLAKQVKLIIQSDSDIVDSFIYLTDGTSRFDSDGNPNGNQIYTWDAGLYHTPVVMLKGNIVDPLVIPYTINASRGGIAFLPTLDGASYVNADLEVVITHIADEITGKLSGKRLKNVDASTFTIGKLDIKRMYGLSHVGQNRHMELAELRPNLRLFDSGDHTTFYAEVPGSELQHSTDVLAINQSKNFTGQDILIGSKHGLLQTSDYIVADLQPNWVVDSGQPVQIIDNILIPKNINHFADTFVRTWDDSLTPKTGRIFFTKDQGLSWQRLKMPTIATDTNTITALATAFQVSTERIETSTGLAKTYEWYTIYNLGTDHGLYSAQIKEGLADDEWDWTYQSYLSTNTKVYAVLEIVTLHETWDNDGNLTETFDRSVYVGAETGFFVNGYLVSNSVVKGIYWLQNGTDPRKNNIIWHTDNEVYVTHTSELIETDTARYYNHPLAYFKQADIVQLTDAKAKTTSNISNFSTSCPSNVDGVTLAAGDRVLVNNQTNGIQNGVYTVISVGAGSNGQWSRATDLGIAINAKSEFYIRVTNGNTYGRSAWHVKGTTLIGTDILNWVNLILRPINDTSRTFNNLHQHAFDPSIYFALTDSNIYRIDDIYDIGTKIWTTLSATQLNWEETNQGSPRCIISDSAGDFGVLRVGTNRGVWKSARAVWDNTDVNAPWVRTSQQFLTSHEPTVFVATDFSNFTESVEYSHTLPTPVLQHSVAYQGFIWNSTKRPWDNFVFEKDYTTFWVQPWNGDNADVVVYIGNAPSDINYILTPELGKIQFTSTIGRINARKVKITIIRPGAFISDIGTIPHGEMPNSFVTNATQSTVLSQDFTAQDTVIHIADEGAIPVGTNYIELRNTINRERLNIVVNPNTKEITLAHPRSGIVTFPKTTTKVYVVNVKSVLGIEDEITKKQTNETYHLNSLGGVNTIQLSISAKNHYTSPALFNNFGSYARHGYNADRGPKNAMFFDFSTDAYDSTKSSSAFFVGNEPTGGIDTVVEPNSIYYIYSPSASGDQMRVGTDQGIWRYSSSGSAWTKESALDGATKTYFIQNVDSVLTSGTDVGAYQKDSSNVWSLNQTFPQATFAQLDNQPWKTVNSVTYTYDAWGKEDGLAFILHRSDSSNFISDHFDALDGRRVYGLHHDQFIRVSTDSQGNTTQTLVNTLYLATEDGLFAVTEGGRDSKYSSVLAGRQMFGDSRPMIEITLPSGGQQQVPVKFYNIAKAQRPNSIPMILFSSNGVYIVRNWRWCDPDPTAPPPVLDFYAESHSLSGISCYSYLQKSEGTTPVVYKLFVATEKGVYRSYDDGYTWERCERIAGGDTAVYTLVSSGTGILAGTEFGFYYSNDDGDTWSIPTSNGNGVAEFDPVVSTAISFNGGYLGQTFKLNAISNDVTKIALHLSPKDLRSSPAYAASLNNTLQIAVYTTSAGNPNSVVAPVGTPDIISANDVLYRGWYYANISVTGLTPGTTYALVVNENIAPGGVSIFKWHSSKVSNPYSNGQAFTGGLIPSWSALTNRDFYFRVYQPAPPTATEIIEPVGIYDNMHPIGWRNGDGRGWYVSDSGELTSNINPLISMVVDDSRSAKWSDPSISNPREIAISNFLTAFYNFTDVSLPGTIFSELSGEVFYPTFADFWVFGSGILERTNGYTNDLIGTIQVVASSLYERGSLSEPYDASDIAFGALSPQSLADAIAKDNDEDNNIERAKRVVEYMNYISALNHADIVAYWNSLPSSEQSEWGTTGGFLNANIPYYSDVRSFVLGRFGELFCPLAIAIVDGDGAGNPSDVALMLQSGWDADGIKPMVLGLGSGHRQQGLRTMATEALGKHVSIIDGTVSSGDWDSTLSSIMPGGDNTVYTAIWNRAYDYEEPTFISVVVANWHSTAGANVIVNYRYTMDRINWSPWIAHSGGGVAQAIGLKILGIEYHIEMHEGTNMGVKSMSYITALYHKVITPGYKYLFTKPQDVNGMVFEYLLSQDIGADWPASADLQWGIVRGDSVDFADFEQVRKNRKGALPNRQASLQFTEEVRQDKLSTITSDFHYYYVKNSSGQTITWATTDIVVAYALVLGQYREVVPDGSDGDFGFVYFANAQPADLIIKVTIITPQHLYTSSGEATTTKDGRTYVLANGSWPKDATAIVIVNGKIKRGGFWLSPDDGTVTFSKERERTDLVTVYIEFHKKFRVGVEIKNYSTASDVTPSNFGLFYTVKPDGRLVFLYDNTNPPAIVDNLVSILPNGYHEPTSSQRLLTNYQFYSSDNNTETGTTTTWWRKRPSDPATYSLPEDPDYPGQNFQQMTYENIETVGMTNRHFPEYNNRTVERKADVNASDWFKTSDIIRVKVTPSDGISNGTTVQSAATTLIGEHIPYVSGVTISATGKVEDPASSGKFYVPSGTELRAYYSYTDTDTGTVVINGTTHTSLVEWFINDSSTVYSTLPTIPAGTITAGQSINFRITPRDGSLPNAHIGIRVMSENIVVR